MVPRTRRSDRWPPSRAALGRLRRPERLQSLPGIGQLTTSQLPPLRPKPPCTQVANSRLGHCKAGAATESCSAAAAPSGSSPWLAATSAKAASATGESQRRQSIPGNCVWYVFVSRYTPLQPRSSKSAQDTYLQTYRQTRIHTYIHLHTYIHTPTYMHTYAALFTTYDTPGDGGRGR